MADLTFAVPGDLDTPTGGYRYDRRMLAEMRALGADVAHLRLPDGFPTPSHAAIIAALDMLAAAPAGPVLVDGLAFGALPSERLAATGRSFVALVHHPLALETGLDARTAARLDACERAALACARGVVTTSAATAATLVESFGVPRDALLVARPGTDPRLRARRDGDPPSILSVGTLSPRKAHGVLIAALELCADLAWRCIIVGGAGPDPEEFARLRAQLTRSTVAGRVQFPGALQSDALDALFARADVFALASLYEGYGMVFAEALANGLPIVATTGGAIPEVVPADAGLLVPPGDATAFAAALRRVLTEPAFGAAAAEAAWNAGLALPRWSEGAAAILDFVGRVGMPPSEGVVI